MKDTFIAGLSMGGYGALIHGLGNREYAAVGSFSGAVKKDVIPEGIAQLNPDLSPENIVDKAVGEGIQASGTVCGLWTVGIFPDDANLEFVDKLKKSRVDVTWVSVEGYEHEWRFWDMQIEDFMKWLPRTDYYAGSIRKV